MKAKFINEDFKIENRDAVIVDKYFYEVIEHLQKRVYPKLNDDNLYALNIRLKKWFNDNLYEGLNE